MATATVPYTFTNGTNADGTQVNANFASLLNFVNTEVIQRDGSIAFTVIPTLPAVDPTLDNHAVRKRYVDNFMPAGTIVQYGGAAAPSGWVLCDGAQYAYGNAAYTRLYTAIGFSYGGSIGTGVFSVPNLKGRVPVGLDATQTEFDVLGDSGGAKTHTLSLGEMPTHTHAQDAHTHLQNAHTHLQDAHTHVQNAHTHIQNSHTHVQDAHGHGQNPHSHFMWLATSSAGTHDHNYTYDDVTTIQRGTGSFSTASAPTPTTGSTGSAGSHTHDVIGYTANETATTIVTTATNQSTTAVNLDATATNQLNTAVNQTTIAVNQSTTAVNQNSGGGAAHNNLQPYVVVNYIIKL